MSMSLQSILINFSMISPSILMNVYILMNVDVLMNVDILMNVNVAAIDIGEC